MPRRAFFIITHRFEVMVLAARCARIIAALYQTHPAAAFVAGVPGELSRHQRRRDEERWRVTGSLMSAEPA